MSQTKKYKMKDFNSMTLDILKRNTILASYFTLGFLLANSLTLYTYIRYVYTKYILSGYMYIEND